MESSSQSLDLTASSVPVSSSAQTSSTASQQEEEQWVSPTGSFPYTSKALYEYYEENPEFKEYYYKYLIPLNYMLGNVWGNGQIAPTYDVVMWLVNSFTDEEKEQYIHAVDINQNGVEYPLVDQEIVEQKALETFSLTSEELRKDSFYYEQYNGYLTMGVGFGVPNVYVVTNAEENEGKLVLTYRQVSSLNFPKITQPKAAPEQIFCLTIEFQTDGSYQYTACEKV